MEKSQIQLQIAQVLFDHLRNVEDCWTETNPTTERYDILVEFKGGKTARLSLKVEED